ncbi:pheromone a factor receptor, partial [Tremellales sp. Uapishka_1]
MAFPHPELLGPSILALPCALYPLPWHLRTHNIAILAMIVWMTALNLVHIVNCMCVVWSDNVDVKAPVWGNISAAVQVGYNYGLPLAHLLLAKQLEQLTSLRPRSALYDTDVKQRHERLDLAISVVGPVAGILIHLSMMDRRFYLIEGFGPMPATYWNTWAVLAFAVSSVPRPISTNLIRLPQVVPILIALGCIVYTIMALVNIHLRRQQLLSMIASDASINKEQFCRLMALAILELGTCILRAIFNLVAFEHGPQPYGHLGVPAHNLSIIQPISAAELTATNILVLRLQFFTVAACSYVFFLCFSSSTFHSVSNPVLGSNTDKVGTETKRFYRTVLQHVCPWLPESHESRLGKNGPWDDEASAGVQNLHSSTSWKETKSSPDDISLSEMLGPTSATEPRTYNSWSRKGSEKTEPDYDGVDIVHLAPFMTDGRTGAGELDFR